MNVTQTKNNKLLKRKEIIAVLDAPSNPGFATAKTTLAEKMKVGEDVIAIKAVRSSFGRGSFVIEAFVYDDVTEKDRIELKPKAPKKAPGAA